MDNAIAAGKSFVGSIIDNTATDAAITPIATAIAIIVPLQFSTSRAVSTIPAITNPSIDTAMTPLANPGKSIIPSSMATPARIAIETDIANSVAAILGESLPIIPTTKARAATITANSLIALNPCSIAAGSIPPRSFTTIDIISMDAAIAKRVVPRLPKLSLPIFDIMVRTAIMTTNSLIALKPCSIAVGSILPRSFTTMVIINIDADIAKSVFPSCSKLSPANIVIKVRKPIMIANLANAEKP